MELLAKSDGGGALDWLGARVALGHVVAAIAVAAMVAILVVERARADLLAAVHAGEVLPRVSAEDRRIETKGHAPPGGSAYSSRSAGRP
jgi:hypothetical protein